MTPDQIVVAMPQVEAHVAMGLIAFPVVVVAGQKQPMLTGWQSTVWDLGMLEAKFRSPRCIGYGLTQPKADDRRLVDLDLDDGKAGLQPGQTPWQDRLAAVEAEHGALPATKTTATPSGGQHRWFVWPDGAPMPGGSWHGFTVRKLFKATNFVVGPGSVRADGRAYVDLDPATPIAEMPLNLALSGGKPKRVNGHADGTPERLTSHDEILSLAGRLRFAGATGPDIETTLLACLADGRIYPSDLAWPWTADELRAIARDIGGKAPGSWTAPITLTGTSRPPVADLDPDVRSATKPPAHLTRQSRAAWYFAQMAGDRVRFDHGRGRWLLWAGHRWQPDEDGAVERLWLDILADRYRDALTIADNDARVRTLEAIQSAGATNAAVAAGLDLASSMKPIATKADAWDPDPWVLGCENGVVELRTGHLRPGRPEEMISRSTGIVYDPTAASPRWAQFLAEVFAGDEELVGWYGLLLGTSLVGEVQELLAIHHGLGNNGKSVAVRALRHAIGDYAVTIPVETLVNAKRSAGDATPDLMALRGARIAFTSEPDQSAKLRGGVLKRLATVDRMTGRSLFGQTQTWDPTHSVNLMTNHLPAVDDATEGFWRRVALVPWIVRFRKPGESGPAPAEDPGLAVTLTAEGPGILAWAVRGAIAYAGGQTLHPFPASVRVRTAAYRADEDKLGAFVSERVIYEPDASVTVGILFAEYKVWCDATSVPTFERMGQKLFARGFEERGNGVSRAMDQTINRVVFNGARMKPSTGSGHSGHRGPIAGPSIRTSDSESYGNRPQVPGMPGDEPPVDLNAEAMRIFGDDLIGGAA